MKSGTILANSVISMIDVKALKDNAKSCRRIRPSLMNMFCQTEIKYSLGEGRSEFSCSRGHPSTVMSLSFCGQALAVEYGVKIN